MDILDIDCCYDTGYGNCALYRVLMLKADTGYNILDMVTVLVPCAAADC